MNTTRRIWAVRLTAFVLLLLPVLAFPSQDTVEEFFGRVQRALEVRDLPAYLASFSGEARDTEASAIPAYFREFGMDTVTLRQAGQAAADEAGSRLFVYALFQNAHAAIVESWQLSLRNDGGAWTIVDKTIVHTVSNLYKIRIPAERVERPAELEIRHRDIRITFEDPLVFHDNVPATETAFIVLGRGRVRFTPSDPVERHILEVLYKKPALDDVVEHLYVRCSNAFFESNVRMAAGRGGLAEPTAKDLVRAAAVFDRNYTRSFTIRNSMDGELLSFPPQGEEAVFEFKGRKLGELTYIFSPFAPEEVNLYDRGRERVINLYSPADPDESGEKLRRMFVRFGERFDVEHADLDVDFDPEEVALSARARLRVSALVDSLDSVKFRLSSDLQVLRITDGQGRELFHTRDRLRDTVYVYLVSPLAKGGTAEVEVHYRGRLIPTPPQTDVLSAAAPQDNRYLFRPRYETFLYTQAAEWYPAPSEDDYHTARIRVTVPPEYACISVGRRAGGPVAAVESGRQGRVAYTYDSAAPVKYVSFLAGKLDTLRDAAAEGMPIRAYASAEVMMPRRDFSPQAREILAFYAGLFGEFPYEKLSIVHRLWPTAGGHSPASFIVVNEPPWPTEGGIGPGIRNPVNLSQYDEYFLAHEIAHQWWGQCVGWETYRDQWLSEGLAQFAAILFLRERYGPAAYASILKRFAQWTERKSDTGPITLGSRLSYYDFEGYQAIVYDKAALALNMLHDLLGPDVFFAGLREFYRANRFSLARTERFVAVMEKASGRDLGSFFEGWFRAYDLPRVKVTTEVRESGGGFELRLRIRQDGRTFVFPLWVESMVAGRARRDLVVVAAADQEFTVRLPGRPYGIKINPDRAVPGRID